MKNIIALLRIKQWIKNFLIFLPLIYSNNLLNIDLLKRTIYGFFLFCILTSIVYIFNDLYDYNKDKKHIIKKNRPIASGRITKKNASIILIFLFILLSTMSIIYKIKNYLNLSSLMIIFAYIIINILYTVIFKNIFILDIFLVSIFYNIRVYFGGIINNIPISTWLNITVFLSALIIVLSKRYSECNNAYLDIRPKHYFIYRNTILKTLLLLINILIILYTIYSIVNIRIIGIEYMLTIPFITLFFLRYFALTKDNKTQEPENFYKDKLLIIYFVIFCIITFISIYLIK